MLKIIVPAKELYDPAKNEFTNAEETVLELEHSLVALSKWEEIFETPFLSRDKKTSQEIFEYIKCMTVTPNVPPEVFVALTHENVKEITDYFDKKMTATWFRQTGNGRPNRTVITAELIYSWMVAFRIDFSAQYWHINKLFTLIKVCNEQQNPPKKRSERELIEEQARLNEERLKKYETTG